MIFNFKKRLIFYILSLIVLISLLSTVAVLLNREIDSRDSSILLNKARLAAAMFPSVSDPYDHEEAVRLCGRIASITDSKVVIEGREGLIASDTGNESARASHADRPEMAEALQGRAKSLVRRDPVTGIKTIYAAVPLPERKSAVLEIWKVQDRDPIITSYVIWSAVLIVFFVLIASLVEIYLRIVLFPSFTRLREVIHDASNSEKPVIRQPPQDDPLASLYTLLDESAASWRSRTNILEASVHELEALFDSMNEPVIVLDADDVVLRANRAANKLFKLKTIVAGGRPVLQQLMCVELDRFVESLRSYERSPQETVAYRRGDDLIYLSVTGMAIEGGGPMDDRLLLVFRDITRMKQLENTRREFVSNVSHELKTPVTTIRGFVEALESGSVEDSKEVSEFISIISRHVNRLSDIIDDLLKLSAIESTEGRIDKSVQPLKPVLKQAVSIALGTNEGRRDDVFVECQEELETSFNANLIEEAVTNLLVNAIRYSEDGTAVTVKAGIYENKVRISVEDRGCGIPKEHISRIFERFYRADEGRDRGKGGTGLGLAIVKHIARAHGGSVHVDSEPGRGSTFTIDLPFSGI